MGTIPSLFRFRSAGGIAALALVLFTNHALRAAEDFRFFAETIEIPERGEVMSQAILSQNHKFSFLPPAGWALEHNAKEKSVTLTLADLTATMGFKITAAKPGASLESNSLAWREKALGRYPEAKILKEFTCYTGGSPGLAFDLERTFANDAKLATRLAFVPFDNGIVEFQLTASPEQIQKHRFVLSCLLNSFRVEPWPAKK